MRIFVIPCWVVAFLGAILAPAQTIHLKNGDVIHADQVTDKNNVVQYEIGDNSYTIPKDRVLSIDASAEAKTPDMAEGLGRQVAVPQQWSASQWDPRLLQEIVRNGQVDRAALETIESQGNAQATALAYYMAARTEFEGARFADARRDLETALRYSPENPAELNYYAALLVRTGNAREAISYAERATQAAPDSPDAFAVLGYAQFSAGLSREAIRSWKKSLALRPDNELQGMLTRAQKELAVEGDYSERESGHFVLRFEGKQSSEAFRTELLRTLESEYQELENEFGTTPRASIQVILYGSQAFTDITRAPSWTGAVNDGKIRLPVEGLTAVSPEFARILKHELAHSFVSQLTLGHCPQWLNEGVAQMLEPRELGGRRARLAQLFGAEREVPLNALERGFSSFSQIEAELAYDESLVVVQYIRAKYGMSDLLRILEGIGQGESAEAALRATIHSDYRQLQDEVRADLRQ